MKTNMYHGASPRLFGISRTLRNQPTPAEEVLWERLRDKRIGEKFRRQHPVSHYIVDFYCHALKYVIETDGPIHLEPSQQLEDQHQDADLTSLGIHVQRFTNNQVLHDTDTVMLEIENTMMILRNKKIADTEF